MTIARSSSTSATLSLFPERDPIPEQIGSLRPRPERRELSQYMTPAYIAELLVERFLPDLTSSDRVIEPFCGTGAFLGAVPSSIHDVVGVELDPLLAARAQERTGRRVVVGDFLKIPMPLEPTLLLGNPPFRAAVVHALLSRAGKVLPEGGRVAMILPVYLLSSASVVTRLAESWSITAEILPRTIFPRISTPVLFTVLRRARGGLLVGLALFREVAAVQQLPEATRTRLADGPAPVWREVVFDALRSLGGEAHLQAIYNAVAGGPRGLTEFWREKVRQVLRQHFVRVAPARYAIP